MSDGSEFQVCGAANENARRANSVRVVAADIASGHRKIAEAEQEQRTGSDQIVQVCWRRRRKNLERQRRHLV